MTLDEALRIANEGAFRINAMQYDMIAAERLAAEVRRLQSEVTALRLYAPAQRAGKMSAPVQIAPTNWPAWGIIDETDEEFAERAGRKVTEDVPCS